MDVVDQGAHDRFLAHVGGSPLNVAGGLAKLGQPTAFLARFSTDPFGRILRAYAAATGADLSLAVDSPSPTTMAVVQLDADGGARYDFYVGGTADWGWTAAELEFLPASVQLVHFGSLTSWLPPGADVVRQRVASLHAAGRVLISYDPNVRPGLLTDPLRAREMIEASVAQAHLVKASIEDLDYLYPGVDPDTIARRWLDLGPILIVITRGADGSCAFSRAGMVFRPAFVVTVVDTVGAGDAFMSGLLDGLMRAGTTSPAQLRDFVADPVKVGRVLEDAAVIAGVVCSRAGAASPTREQLDAVRR